MTLLLIILKKNKKRDEEDYSIRTFSSNVLVLLSLSVNSTFILCSPRNFSIISNICDAKSPVTVSLNTTSPSIYTTK